MKQETVRRCLKTLLACTFVFWASGRVNASNHVTVATIGNSPPAYDPAQGMQIRADLARF